jgi:hypothetical protein
MPASRIPRRFVGFLAEKRSELRAASSYRVKDQGKDLDLGHLQGCAEPIYETGNRFFRRVCWRNDPLPDIRVDIIVSGFNQSRHVWQSHDALPRSGREGAQLARLQLLRHSGVRNEGRRHMFAERCVNCRSVARIRDESHIDVGGALEPLEGDVHTGRRAGSCQS